ncbi:uncharacterized protein LOC144627474 [Crassostrea virginica]
MNISICMESTDACEISNQTIFSNNLIQKRNCTFNDQLPQGFSLSSWKVNNSYDADASLPDYVKGKVEDLLKLSGYRKPLKCSRNVSPYWPTYNGWNHDKACRISDLPYNMEKKTSCYVGASCTEMTCCTDDPEMDTTFSWFIDVDFCHLKLSVGIENTKQEMFLSDITFGEEKCFSLQGVYRLSYIIYDLVSDSHYMMSVNVSVCYEPDNCTLTENVVENGMFPKPVCDFKSTDFVIPGFSMIDWLKKHKFSSLTPLPEYGQLELLTDLGLANYMKIKLCTDLDDIYRYQSDGWTKG